MKAHVVARNSFWSSVDVAVSLLGGVISSVAVARAMGPEKLGFYNYALWWVGMAGAFGTLGMGTATRKYISEYIGRGDMPMAHAVLQLTGRVQFAVAVALLLVGTAGTLLYTAPEHRTYTLIAVASLLPSMMLGTFTHANIAAEDFRSNATASLASMLVNFGGVALVLLLGGGLTGLTASLFASKIVDIVLRQRSFAATYRRLGIARPGLWPGSDTAAVPADLRRSIVRFALQAGGLQLIEMLVWSRPQLWFLKKYSDIRELAFYSLGLNLTDRILQVPQIFNSAVGASLMVQYGRDPQSVGRYTGIALRYMGLAAMPLLLGLAAVSGPFVRVLYGEQYAPAAAPLAIAAAFGLIRAFHVTARQLLAAADQQTVLVRWVMFLSVLNFAVSYALIPSGGAVGAAFANGIVQVLAVGGAWYFTLTRLHFTLPWLQLGRLFATAALMALAVAGVTRLLPPLPGLVAGVAVGALLYLGLVRFSGGLDNNDRNRLLDLKDRLPKPIRRPYHAAVALVAR